MSGGGTSSGLMSFLKIGDRAAGAIKSGGTTRRAAKMVCLDLDHPEMLNFIDWKVEEEKKVAALIAAGYASDYEGEAYRTVSGQNSNNSVRIPNSFFEKLEKNEDWELKARIDGRVMKKVPATAHCGIRLPMQHGVVQTREPNTILPLMSGIPARKVAVSGPPTLVASICSLTIPPVTWHL